MIIPTTSSRPHHHPNELSEELVLKIVEYRRKYERCAEVLQVLLARDGYLVSLSSVKRTLVRQGLVYTSPWKRRHDPTPRPAPEAPGSLIELDTIHDGAPGSVDHLYIYTLIDVFSRWAYAVPTLRISAAASVAFVGKAERHAPFTFGMLQSDHGSEFSQWFTGHVDAQHRHIRVRTPNDNAHIERFNRSIQDEYLSRVPRNLRAYQHAIPDYLAWYNGKRPHLALEMKSPLDMMRRC